MITTTKLPSSPKIEIDKLNKFPSELELYVHYCVYSKTKRLIDICGAIVGLAITFVIAIPIYIAMQLDNPGPLLYKQIRCGVNGKHFWMWKFRSMIVNAEHQKHLIQNQAQGHIFKNENDPRVTRLGQFLRRTSIDEFPQFWNVLRGEMSLVGTRPPIPSEVKYYNSYHYQRLQVKPGLTGEWQVNGRSQINDFEDIVRLDIDYQKKWSPLYDLKLILRTIVVVLARKGAY